MIWEAGLIQEPAGFLFHIPGFKRRPTHSARIAIHLKSDSKEQLRRLDIADKARRKEPPSNCVAQGSSKVSVLIWMTERVDMGTFGSIHTWAYIRSKYHSSYKEQRADPNFEQKDRNTYLIFHHRNVENNQPKEPNIEPREMGSVTCVQRRGRSTKRKKCTDGQQNKTVKENGDTNMVTHGVVNAKEKLRTSLSVTTAAL
ncbi:hypothetical protein C8J56DRAFT_884401 [Mycena floridula]|nr:hypothetical protein C8J56DRAFT_884401 [Mycena floridula]